MCTQQAHSHVLNIRDFRNISEIHRYSALGDVPVGCTPSVSLQWGVWTPIVLSHRKNFGSAPKRHIGGVSDFAYGSKLAKSGRLFFGKSGISDENSIN